MNSPFAKILIALQDFIPTALAAYTPDGGVIFVDLDHGQLDVREAPPVSFPCVLIDFQNWKFSDEAELVQIAEGDIVFKIATDPYSATSSITPDTWRDNALTILDMEHTLYQALEGRKIATAADKSTTPLGRIAYTSDNRRPGLKVRINTYTTSFRDYAARRPVSTVIKPNPAITGEIIPLVVET